MQQDGVLYRTIALKVTTSKISMITFTTSYNSDLLIRKACEGQHCEGAVLPLLVVCSNEKRLKYNLTVQQPFLITPQLGFFQKIAYRFARFEID